MKLKDIHLKIGFMFLIFALTVIMGVLPQRISGLSQKTSSYLGIANTFSGGVFLAIAFVHIIPEAASGYYLYLLEWESDHIQQ